MALTGIRQTVFLDRYARKNEAGEPVEKTPEEMWRRVARAIASVEPRPKREHWEQKFYEVMENFVFVPGGRILSGAGTGYKVTFYNCLPPDQEVLTPSGYKPIKTIREGDQVITGKKRPRTVRRVFTRETEEPLYIIRLTKLGFDDVRLTGEHPVWAIKNEWVNRHRSRDGLRLKNGPQWIKAADLKKGDFVAVAWNQHIGDFTKIHLKDYLPETFTSVGQKVTKNQLKKPVNEEITIDDAFMLLAGTWLGDGCVTHRTGTDIPAGIQITFNVAQKQWAQEIGYILQQKFAVVPTIREDRWGQRLIQVRVESYPIGLFFQNFFGAYSYKKRIPHVLMEQPTERLLPLIKGMFRADGYLSKNNLGIALSNKTLAVDLHQILLRTGRFFTIFQNNAKGEHHDTYRVTAGVSQANGLCEYIFGQKKANAHHDQDYFLQHDDVFWVRIDSLNTVSYKGTVYDLEVEEDHSFITAGVVVSNCFVIPSPHDSRGGILTTLSQMVEIMSRGGGVGINLSSLRPRGSRVKRVNGFSSGPINWAELFSVATKDIIQQGGSRRGALMLMLWDWHPDIEEFITVKQDLARINGANLSVCVSDKFMEAVKQDLDWELIFPDRSDPDYDTKWDGYLPNWLAAGKKVIVHKTIKARALWDLIAKAAWQSAEPGVVFMERYNKWFNNYYFEYVNCVNPCVTGDTLVATEYGWMKAKELTVGTKILTPKGLKPIDKIYNNGKQEIYEVLLSDGGHLEATADHKLRVVRGKKYEWVKIVDLKKNDAVVVVDRAVLPQEKKTLPERVIAYAEKNNLRVNSAYDRDLGFLIGVTIGDGYFGQIGHELGYRMKLCYGRKEQTWGKVLIQAIQKFGADPKVVTIEKEVLYPAVGVVAKHGSIQMCLYKLANVLGMSGLEPKTGRNKHIPYHLLNLDEEFQKGLLDGLFSTDGSVSMKAHDPMLRLSSVSKELLEQVRLLLLNFGIHSRIYKGFRRKFIYDGRDMKGTGYKYDLLVMNESIARFYEVIGLSHPEKAARLKQVAQEYYFVGGTNLARVLSVRDTGRKEDVYDVHEPETLTWVTNGYVSLDCGEEGLPNWGVCNLCSINLGALVNETGEMDYQRLAEVAKIGVRFQDDVIEADAYVFDEIKKVQLGGERRIGLGTMGLGDALIKMKLRYGSLESLRAIDKIYQTIRDAAYEASVAIAAEKGPFPKIDIKKHLEGYFIKQLPEEVRRKMQKHGVRNSVILQQAPTGTTSLLAGTSSGIEPVYEFEFVRRDRLGEHILRHPLYEAWIGEFKKTHDREPAKSDRPDYFVSANDLTPEDHVRVQAAIQKYVDASISKTVNAPNGHSIDDVKKLYTLAYELGCKGITYMREGSRPGVLSRPDTAEVDKKEEVKMAAPEVKPRPMVLHGSTYEVDTPVGKAFVTINTNGGNQPSELFINVGKAGSDVTAMAEALGKVISLTLRMASPVPPTERAYKIASMLVGIGGARSLGFGENRVRSLPDAVAKVIDRHFGFFTKSRPYEALNGNGQVNGHVAAPAAGNGSTKLPLEVGGQESPATTPSQLVLNEKRMVTVDLCPSCGEGSLVFEEACKKCYNCGYSEC